MVLSPPCFHHTVSIPERLLSMFSFSSFRTLLVLTLSTGLLLTGCDLDEEAEETDEAPQIPVETLVSESSDFVEQINLTGELEALDDATVSTQAAGRLMSLTALGNSVSDGQVVARLDTTGPRAAVRQARAQKSAAETQLELAEDNLSRQEPLYEDSVISASEFEQFRSEYRSAQASLDQAEGALEEANERLRQTRIEAPFDGVVEDHIAKRGEEVSPGAPVARIVKLDPLKARVGVPERYAGEIERGTEITARLRAFQDNSFTGEVVFVGSTVNPANRTFAVEFEIPNPEGRLKPQMVASVDIPRQRLEDVIVVPRRAIEQDEDGNRLYVLTGPEDDPRVEMRDVRVGPSQGARTAILDGVSAGEEVIVQGQDRVSDGDRVDVRERYQTVDESLIQPRSTQPRADR